MRRAGRPVPNGRGGVRKEEEEWDGKRRRSFVLGKHRPARPEPTRPSLEQERLLPINCPPHFMDAKLEHSIGKVTGQSHLLWVC